MTIRTIHFSYIIPAVLLYCLCSCNRKSYPYQFSYTNLPETPDYTRLEHWAAHPDKWDPSDSIPRPFRKNKIQNREVDVFFIYPTTFTADTAVNWNAGINDSILNHKTDYSAILYQASAFNDGTRVFAPRYRQAHYRCFFAGDKQKAAAAFEMAYHDIENAFAYYLQNYKGKNRLIIAAHSQGTLHAARLIKKYFDAQPDISALVAAYLIGMPVPYDYFKTIPACTDPYQNGCIVSWRTFNRGFTDTVFAGKENFRSIVTNPLRWDTALHYANHQMNEGGILKNFNRLKKEVVDAQIHDNVLWTCKPRIFGKFLIRQRNYHVGDINLFYASIRRNVTHRINRK
jgi:hypothetical protein